jgi:hypothetical protein
MQKTWGKNAFRGGLLSRFFKDFLGPFGDKSLRKREREDWRKITPHDVDGKFFQDFCLFVRLWCNVGGGIRIGLAHVQSMISSRDG